MNFTLKLLIKFTQFLPILANSIMFSNNNNNSLNPIF